MGKLIDMTGRRFGALLVIEQGRTLMREDGTGSVVFWRVRCDCGSEHEARGTDLRMGHSKSCGCLQSTLRRQTLATSRAAAASPRRPA